MTKEQIYLLNLNISPLDAQTALIVESGLEWVKENTTLKFDTNNDEDLTNLPAAVRLFLVKYAETMSISAGVTSESIEGLSQSYNSGDKAAILWDIATSLLSKWLISPVKFVPAVKRWK